MPLKVLPGAAALSVLGDLEEMHMLRCLLTLPVSETAIKSSSLGFKCLPGNSNESNMSELIAYRFRLF